MAKLYGVTQDAMLKAVNDATPGTMDGEVTDYNWWKTVLIILKLEDKMEEIWKHWQEDLNYWLSDTKKLMSELDIAGYKIAILTNNWENQTEDLKKNLSKYANIQFYFESSVLKMSKPSEKLYRYVEKTIKASGDEIFFIDDIQKYLEGTKKLGWQTFLYSRGDDEGKSSNDLIRKQLL